MIPVDRPNTNSHPEQNGGDRYTVSLTRGINSDKWSLASANTNR